MRQLDRCSGYDEGYEDGMEDAEDSGFVDHEACEDEARWAERRGRDELLERLHTEIDRRQAGADLPFPIYRDVMSLEEVRQMIRRVGQ